MPPKGQLPGVFAGILGRPPLRLILPGSATTGFFQPNFWPDSLPWKVQPVPEGSGLPSLANGQIWVGDNGVADATTPTGSDGVEVDTGPGSLNVKLNVGGTAHQVLHGGTTPTMGPVDLTNDVTNAAQIAGPPARPPAGNLNLAYLQTSDGHYTLAQTSPAGDQMQTGFMLQTGTNIIRPLKEVLVLDNNQSLDIQLAGLGGSLIATDITNANIRQARGGIGSGTVVTFTGVSTGFSVTQGNMGTINITGVAAGVIRVQNLTGAGAAVLLEVSMAIQV